MVKKKVLVAGGAGFIGSMVNQMLQDCGYETVVIDNLSSGHKETVLQGTFIEVDLLNTSHLRKVFAEHTFDAVLHFAALINVGESVLKPDLYYQNNVMATLNLLNIMKEFDVKKLVFSSTAAVYGLPKTPLITEDHQKNPINPYGKTKWMIESILEDYDRAFNLKSISLRYFNAAGADPKNRLKVYNQNPSNLIPIIVRAISLQKPVTVYGNTYATKDGSCVRDYIHIYDLATAHLAALKALLDGQNSNVFNLGNGNGYTVFEVIKAAEKVTGRTIPIIQGERRDGDPAQLLADATKAKKYLNWNICYPHLEEMIEHAFNSRFIT